MGTRRAVSSSFCRDCLAEAAPQSARCPACGSPRLLRHEQLATLSIAHVDCDAFYATIEKRDDPSLAAEPVIVGGGRRGVVAAACYVARTFGVKSAMPMFEALKLCPQAKVIRPNMEKYSEVGREVRQMMLALDAARRTIVDRRSLSRPLRHRAPARHVARQSARTFRRRRRENASDYRFDRALLQQISRQGGLRSRQAEGICGAERERSAEFSGAEAGELHLRRRQSQRSATRSRRLSPHCRPAEDERDRADAALWRRRPATGSARARHRRAQRQRGSRDKKRILRDDIRARHFRVPRARTHSVGLVGRRLGASEVQELLPGQPSP